MVDLTPFLPGLSPVQSKAVVARFDGGRLSSEGGLLALREIERRLGLADRLANCLVDPRAPERVEHRLACIDRARSIEPAARDVASQWERKACAGWAPVITDANVLPAGREIHA